MEGSDVLGTHFGEGAVSVQDMETECRKGHFLNLVPDIYSLTNIW